VSPKKKEAPEEESASFSVLPLNHIVGLPGDEVTFTLASPELVDLVRAVHGEQKSLFTVCQQNMKVGESLSTFGVLAMVKDLEDLDGGKLRFKLAFVQRMEALSLEKTVLGLRCQARVLNRRGLSEVEHGAIEGELRESWRSCMGLVGQVNLKVQWKTNQEFDLLASKMIRLLEFNLENRLAFLEGWSLRRRGRWLLEQIEKHKQVLLMRRQLKQRTTERVKRLEKEAFLQEEKKLIDGELGRSGNKPCPPEFQALKDNMAEFSGPEDIKVLLEREFDRLLRAGSHSPHASTIQDYLETVLGLPWGVEQIPNGDWQAVETSLRDSHFGLENIKDRILRYLAVVILSGHQPGSILCLIGPPGVGKTSFARAISEALQLPFVKKSLGGVRDESDIRGHRRTYIGAMPGRIVQGLKKAECMNPVFLLDEVDKMGNDHRGDPASALLEVLDPEENFAFSDHYIEHDLDLSKVFWVLTANSEAGIPAPLRDRLEIIRFSGYTETEKLHIAKDFLCRRSMEKQGLDGSRLKLSDAVLKKIIREYTREAGVRDLGRRLSNLVQFMALDQLKLGKKGKWSIAQKRLAEVFGPALHEKPEWKKNTWVPGIMAGLAWTAAGGTVMKMECARHPGKGQLRLTGKLGEVMQESAHTAMTFLKTNGDRLDLADVEWGTLDLHVHIPAGSVPKEGPSAGLGLALLMTSLLTGRTCRPFWAMTGEISLHGQVLAIGGVKEKLLAAQQHGFEGVLLPLANREDVEDIQLDELKSLDIRYVRSFWDAFDFLF
jgi:ATP-dependent Lon protease